MFGTLEYYGGPFQASVPATATAGEPFDVTVVTYGAGCIEKGETTVQVDGLQTAIRPYDVDTQPASGDCPAILRAHEHNASVTFAEAGEAKVVFYGLREDETGTLNVSHTRTVTVR